MRKNIKSKIFRLIACFILITFTFETIFPQEYLQAQLIANPSALVRPTPIFQNGLNNFSKPFVPMVMRGIVVHPENPLEFDFIFDNGQNSNSSSEEFQSEAKKLIKHFLASLTIPEKELWVNLSPKESDRIIPGSFGVTEMGKEVLAQDFLLKKLTSSMMHPDGETGKKLWDRIYKRMDAKYGSHNMPADTLSKVWIVPNKAVIFEQENSAYVIECSLKVMLEEDYVKSSRQKVDPVEIDPIKNDFNNIIREIVIPEIEHEVNFGEGFAPLRQIVHSLVLAGWYKQALHESLLGQIYVDQGKTQGVDSKDKNFKTNIYNQYLESFKRGAFNVIREEYDQTSQTIIPRKFFSGGLNLTDLASPQFGQADVKITRDRSVFTAKQLDALEGDGFGQQSVNTLVVEATSGEVGSRGTEGLDNQSLVNIKWGNDTAPEPLVVAKAKQNVDRSGAGFDAAPFLMAINFDAIKDYIPAIGMFLIFMAAIGSLPRQVTRKEPGKYDHVKNMSRILVMAVVTSIAFTSFIIPSLRNPPMDKDLSIYSPYKDLQETRLNAWTERGGEFKLTPEEIKKRDELVARYSPMVMETVEELLNHADPNLKKLMLTAIGTERKNNNNYNLNKELIDAVIQLADSDDENVKQAAIQALFMEAYREIHAQEIIDVAPDKVAENDQWVAGNAPVVINKIGSNLDVNLLGKDIGQELNIDKTVNPQFIDLITTDSVTLADLTIKINDKIFNLKDFLDSKALTKLSVGDQKRIFFSDKLTSEQIKILSAKGMCILPIALDPKGSTISITNGNRPVLKLTYSLQITNEVTEFIPSDKGNFKTGKIRQLRQADFLNLLKISSTFPIIGSKGEQGQADKIKDLDFDSKEIEFQLKRILPEAAIKEYKIALAGLGVSDSALLTVVIIALIHLMLRKWYAEDRIDLDVLTAKQQNFYKFSHMMGLMVPLLFFISGSFFVKEYIRFKPFVAPYYSIDSENGDILPPDTLQLEKIPTDFISAAKKAEKSFGANVPEEMEVITGVVVHNLIECDSNCEAQYNILSQLLSRDQTISDSALNDIWRILLNGKHTKSNTLLSEFWKSKRIIILDWDGQELAAIENQNIGRVPTKIKRRVLEHLLSFIIEKRIRIPLEVKGIQKLFWSMGNPDFENDARKHALEVPSLTSHGKVDKDKFDESARWAMVATESKYAQWLGNEALSREIAEGLEKGTHHIVIIRSPESAHWILSQLDELNVTSLPSIRFNSATARTNLRNVLIMKDSDLTSLGVAESDVDRILDLLARKNGEILLVIRAPRNSIEAVQQKVGGVALEIYSEPIKIFRNAQQIGEYFEKQPWNKSGFGLIAPLAGGLGGLLLMASLLMKSMVIKGKKGINARDKRKKGEIISGPTHQLETGAARSLHYFSFIGSIIAVLAVYNEYATRMEFQRNFDPTRGHEVRKVEDFRRLLTYPVAKSNINRLELTNPNLLSAFNLDVEELKEFGAFSEANQLGSSELIVRLIRLAVKHPDSEIRAEAEKLLKVSEDFENLPIDKWMGKFTDYFKKFPEYNTVQLQKRTANLIVSAFTNLSDKEELASAVEALLKLSPNNLSDVYQAIEKQSSEKAKYFRDLLELFARNEPELIINNAQALDLLNRDDAWKEWVKINRRDIGVIFSKDTEDKIVSGSEFLAETVLSLAMLIFLVSGTRWGVRFILDSLIEEDNDIDWDDVSEQDIKEWPPIIFSRLADNLKAENRNDPQTTEALLQAAATLTRRIDKLNRRIVEEDIELDILQANYETEKNTLNETALQNKRKKILVIKKAVLVSKNNLDKASKILFESKQAGFIDADILTRSYKKVIRLYPGYIDEYHTVGRILGDLNWMLPVYHEMLPKKNESWEFFKDRDNLIYAMVAIRGLERLNTDEAAVLLRGVLDREHPGKIGALREAWQTFEEQTTFAEHIYVKKIRKAGALKKAWLNTWDERGLKRLKQTTIGGGKASDIESFYDLIDPPEGKESKGDKKKVVAPDYYKHFMTTALNAFRHGSFKKSATEEEVQAWKTKIQKVVSDAPQEDRSIASKSATTIISMAVLGIVVLCSSSGCSSQYYNETSPASQERIYENESVATLSAKMDLITKYDPSKQGVLKDKEVARVIREFQIWLVNPENISIRENAAKSILPKLINAMDYGQETATAVDQLIDTLVNLSNTNPNIKHEIDELILGNLIELLGHPNLTISRVLNRRLIESTAENTRIELVNIISAVTRNPRKSAAAVRVLGNRFEALDAINAMRKGVTTVEEYEAALDALSIMGGSGVGFVLTSNSDKLVEIMTSFGHMDEKSFGRTDVVWGTRGKDKDRDVMAVQFGSGIAEFEKNPETGKWERNERNISTRLPLDQGLLSTITEFLFKSSDVKAVENLIDAAKLEGNPEKSIPAIRRLGQLDKSQEAISALMDIFFYSDKEVAKEAFLALREMKNRDLQRTLILEKIGAQNPGPLNQFFFSVGKVVRDSFAKYAQARLLGTDQAIIREIVSSGDFIERVRVGDNIFQAAAQTGATYGLARVISGAMHDVNGFISAFIDLFIAENAIESQARDKIIAQLRSRDPREGMRYLTALLYLNAQKDDIPILLSMVSSDDWIQQVLAYDSLSKLNYQMPLENLKEILSNTNIKLASNAAFALGFSNNMGAVDLLKSALGRHPSLDQEIIGSLSRLAVLESTSESAVNVLLELAQSEGIIKNQIIMRDTVISVMESLVHQTNIAEPVKSKMQKFLIKSGGLRKQNIEVNEKEIVLGGQVVPITNADDAIRNIPILIKQINETGTSLDAQTTERLKNDLISLGKLARMIDRNSVEYKEIEQTLIYWIQFGLYDVSDIAINLILETDMQSLGNVFEKMDVINRKFYGAYIPSLQLWLKVGKFFDQNKKEVEFNNLLALAKRGDSNAFDTIQWTVKNSALFLVRKAALEGLVFLNDSRFELDAEKVLIAIAEDKNSDIAGYAAEILANRIAVISDEARRNSIILAVSKTIESSHWFVRQQAIDSVYSLTSSLVGKITDLENNSPTSYQGMEILDEIAYLRGILLSMGLEMGPALQDRTDPEQEGFYEIREKAVGIRVDIEKVGGLPLRDRTDNDRRVGQNSGSKEFDTPLRKKDIIFAQESVSQHVLESIAEKLSRGEKLGQQFALSLISFNWINHSNPQVRLIATQLSLLIGVDQSKLIMTSLSQETDIQVFEAKILALEYAKVDRDQVLATLNSILETGSAKSKVLAETAMARFIGDRKIPSAFSIESNKKLIDSDDPLVRKQAYENLSKFLRSSVDESGKIGTLFLLLNQIGKEVQVDVNDPNFNVLHEPRELLFKAIGSMKIDLKQAALTNEQLESLIKTILLYAQQFKFGANTLNEQLKNSEVRNIFEAVGLGNDEFKLQNTDLGIADVLLELLELERTKIQISPAVMESILQYAQKTYEEIKARIDQLSQWDRNVTVNPAIDNLRARVDRIKGISINRNQRVNELHESVKRAETPAERMYREKQLADYLAERNTASDTLFDVNTALFESKDPRVRVMAYENFARFVKNSNRQASKPNNLFKLLSRIEKETAVDPAHADFSALYAPREALFQAIAQMDISMARSIMTDTQLQDLVLRGIELGNKYVDDPQDEVAEIQNAEILSFLTSIGFQKNDLGIKNVQFILADTLLKVLENDRTRNQLPVTLKDNIRQFADSAYMVLVKNRAKFINWDPSALDELQRTFNIRLQREKNRAGEESNRNANRSESEKTRLLNTKMRDLLTETIDGIQKMDETVIKSKAIELMKIADEIDPLRENADFNQMRKIAERLEKEKPEIKRGDSQQSSDVDILKVLQEKMSAVIGKNDGGVKYHSKDVALNVSTTRFEREAVAKADLSSDRSKAHDVGGVNLDPSLFKWEIKRNNSGVPLPMKDQPSNIQLKIKGFIPLIRSLKPVSVPQMLGLKNNSDQSQKPIDIGYKQPAVLSEVEPLSYNRKTYTNSKFTGFPPYSVNA